MTRGPVAWVESAVDCKLNDDQARCVTVLCSFSQPYNLQLIGDGWAGAVPYNPAHDRGFIDDDIPVLPPVEIGPKWVIVRLRNFQLATYDLPELTRLVLAGHDHAVRVEIGASLNRWVQTEDVHAGEEPMSGPEACLRISLHARIREAGAPLSTWERHPTLGEAIATHG